MTLHTKYQGSRPYVFFNVFPIKAYVNNVNPGLGHSLPQGHYLNKLGIGLLGDAAFQISRLLAVWLQTRRFVSMVSL